MVFSRKKSINHSYFHVEIVIKKNTNSLPKIGGFKLLDLWWSSLIRLTNFNMAGACSGALKSFHCKIKRKIIHITFFREIEDIFFFPSYLQVMIMFDRSSFCGLHIKIRTIGSFSDSSFGCCQCQLSNNVIGKSFFGAEPNVQ